MMSTVTCPSCQHKQMLPESAMGKLQTCPQCQSSFVAGKSVAESRAGSFGRAAAVGGGGASSSSADAGYNKTMLADSTTPYSYPCPRCKTSLEATSIEAGTKKNCPHCSQRHQVPQPPPSAAVAPPPPPPPAGLNKTMLVGEESTPPIKYSCPTCQKPLEAQASEAKTKKNCPHCSQRHQVPAASIGLNKTKLVGDDDGQGRSSAPGGATLAGAGSAPTLAGDKGEASDGSVRLTPLNIGLGAAVILLLALVIPAVIRGGAVKDENALAQAKLELEKLKQDIELKKAEMDRQKNAEDQTRRQFETMMNEMRAREERQREEQRQLLRSIADAKAKAEFEEKANADRRKLEEERREIERKQQQALEDAQKKLEESKRALEASQQKQQTIVHQAPPVVYYPPYHPRYYWPW